MGVFALTCLYVSGIAQRLGLLLGDPHLPVWKTVEKHAGHGVSKHSFLKASSSLRQSVPVYILQRLRPTRMAVF